jgi:uncharacterized phiE125 gp8 family phage protein
MFFVDVLTDPAGAVAPAYLADRLGVDASDPLLPGYILAATEAAGQYLRRATTARQLRVTYTEWPTTGAQGRWVSGTLARVSAAVDLPYTGPVISVDAVEGDGEPITDWQLVRTNPARLVLAPVLPLVVTYTAGWQVLPAPITEAVAMLAAYLYEHRGQCDAGDAITKSGAAFLLNPYRVEL